MLLVLNLFLPLAPAVTTYAVKVAPKTHKGFWDASGTGFP